MPDRGGLGADVQTLTSSVRPQAPGAQPFPGDCTSAALIYPDTRRAHATKSTRCETVGRGSGTAGLFSVSPAARPNLFHFRADLNAIAWRGLRQVPTKPGVTASARGLKHPILLRGRESPGTKHQRVLLAMKQTLHLARWRLAMNVSVRTSQGQRQTFRDCRSG